MDTGEGRFEQFNIDNIPQVTLEDRLAEVRRKLEAAYPQHGGWFQEGEIVELKGSRFRVKSIKPTELRLKLLPKEG